MTNCKVVVLDMDNTLLGSDNMISEEIANYLTTIQDEGYYVVLTSGKPTEDMIPTARDLKLPEHHSYIISYDGSKTVNMTNEEVEVSKSTGKQDFDEIVDYCRDRSSFVLTYHDGQTIYDSEHRCINIEAELMGLPMKRAGNIKAYIQGDMPKVMGVNYVASITEARINLSGMFNDNVDATTGKPFLLGFMAKDVLEDNVIKALCHKLGYSMDQAVAFGDSMSDKSMFEVVGLAIATENASDEPRQCVNEVMLDHSESGILHALKKLLQILK